MLIVQIDDIYKMILEDSVLDRSFTRKETKSWIIGSTKDPYMLRKISSDKYILLGAAYIHGMMDGDLADSGLIQDVEQIALM